VAARLASLTDGIIMVIEAETIRWEAALRGKNALIEAEADVLGGVLNKRRMVVPGWLYRRI
jgi:Mrp family chromosome partitioning ATPase